MSITNFYPQELVADGFSYEEADVTLSTEELDTLIDSACTEITSGLKDVSLLLNAVESTEAISKDVLKLKESNVLNQASINSINTSIESILKVCEYPIIPILEYNNFNTSAEGLGDSIKKFGTNAYEAARAIIKKIIKAIRNMIRWIKSKIKILFRNNKQYKEDIKKAPDPAPGNTIKITATRIKILLGASIISLDSVVRDNAIDDNALLIGAANLLGFNVATVDTLLKTPIPTSPHDFNLEKPIIDLANSDIAKANSKVKGFPPKYYVVTFDKDGDPYLVTDKNSKIESAESIDIVEDPSYTFGKVLYKMKTESKGVLVDNADDSSAYYVHLPDKKTIEQLLSISDSALQEQMGKEKAADSLTTRLLNSSHALYKPLQGEKMSEETIDLLRSKLVKEYVAISSIFKNTLKSYMTLGDAISAITEEALKAYNAD